MRRIIESDEDKDFDAYFPDITFHRAIASASKNRLLSLFMLSIRMTISTLAKRYVLPEAKQVSQDHHRLIYEAILDQDEALGPDADEGTPTDGLRSLPSGCPQKQWGPDAPRKRGHLKTM